MEDVHARFIRALELSGDLDRAVEALPSDEELTRSPGRRARPHARPSWPCCSRTPRSRSQDDVLASALPEDPDFAPVLAEYFPPEVRDRYASQIDDHQLRREIIVTALVNGMVNRAGSTFAFRLGRGDRRVSRRDRARARSRARRVPAVGAVERDRAARRRRRGRHPDVDVPRVPEDDRARQPLVPALPQAAARGARRRVEALRPGVDRLTVVLPGLLCGSERDWYDEEKRAARGARRPAPSSRSEVATPRRVAHRARHHRTSPRPRGGPVDDVAALFCVVGNRLALDWLRDRAVDLPRNDRWQALSRRALLEDIDGEHRRITSLILATTDPGFEPAHAYDVWAESEHAGEPRSRARAPRRHPHPRRLRPRDAVGRVLRELRSRSRLIACSRLVQRG